MNTIIDCLFIFFLVKNWYNDLLRVFPLIKIGIILNKIDCSNISETALIYSKGVAESKKLPYIEISCKTNLDIGKIKEFLERIENM